MDRDFEEPARSEPWPEMTQPGNHYLDDRHIDVRTSLIQDQYVQVGVARDRVYSGDIQFPAGSVTVADGGPGGLPGIREEIGLIPDGRAAPPGHQMGFCHVISAAVGPRLDDRRQRLGEFCQRPAQRYVRIEVR